MNDELKKSLKIAALFISCGLFVLYFVFFLLFGKGLQILIPGILFIVFFAVYLVFEKIPFISERPALKAVLSVAVLCFIAIII